MSKISLIDNEIVELSGETHPDLGLFIHVDMKKWDKSSLKEAKQIWVEFINQCIEKGIEAIHCGIPNSDPKNEKFAVMFGFEQTGLVLLDDQGQYKLTLWVFNTTE